MRNRKRGKVKTADAVALVRELAVSWLAKADHTASELIPAAVEMVADYYGYADEAAALMLDKRAELERRAETTGQCQDCQAARVAAALGVPA